MKNLPVLTLVLVGTMALAACGTSNQDRALSGGAIGAGVGAAGAAVVGGSVAGGALIGAGVGAATGVLTDEDDIDLDN